MVSKGDPTNTKKESWNEWNMLQDKKKKWVSSCSDNDTIEKGIVHRIGIVVIVTTKSWESVATSHDDDKILPSIISASLTKREC